ncbi:DcrB-related protein [Serratia fonticola]|uniref:DcrB-related protein n=1 Tax=Serratia fonticola TaxID=47917 RepID=UPI0015C65795|nr:DcrB-related protein [Serratia fonticola]NYA43040.1 DcrB-related protein [Serratia fonticola]
MYVINEGTLEMPENWQDETMNALIAQDNSGLNIVITRLTLPFATDREAFYQQTISQFRDNLKKYQENDYRVISLADEPAHLLDYRWQSPEGRIDQVAVMQIRGNQLITFTLSSSKGMSTGQKERMLAYILTFKPHAQDPITENQR